MINTDKSLEIMEKLTRNTAQAPAEEKFRQVRAPRKGKKKVVDPRDLHDDAKERSPQKT